MIIFKDIEISKLVNQIALERIIGLVKTAVSKIYRSPNIKPHDLARRLVKYLFRPAEF